MGDPTNEPGKERLTRSRRAKRRCTCDALGSGICPECAEIVHRRTAADVRRRGGVTQGPGLTLSQPTATDHSDGRLADIADRLTAAARLIESGRFDLDGIARIVAGALTRIDRLRDPQAPPGVTDRGDEAAI